MGDPAGIGPEVVLKAVAEEEISRVCAPVIIGDAQLLAHTARTLDLQCGYDIIRQGEPLPENLAEPVIFHLDNIGGFVEPGIESGAAGKAAAGYIEAAVALCAAGSVDAIATAPINKRALFLGGYSFPGHTEFLAHLTGSEDSAMAFVAAHPGCAPFVAETDDAIVGTGVATINGAVGWIGTIWVDPAWRRRGLGRALTIATMDAAETAGCRTLVLSATAAGLRLYAQRAGRCRKGFPDDALAILHARRLATGPEGRVRAGLLADNEAGEVLLSRAGWVDAWQAPRLIRGPAPGWDPTAIWGQFDLAVG